jgi:hypothetical protein
MKQLAQHAALKNEFIARGFEQIKKFSWQVTAEKTWEVYNKVL